MTAPLWLYAFAVSWNGLLVAMVSGFGVTETLATVESLGLAGAVPTTNTFFADVMLCVVAEIVALPALRATMWPTEPEATPVLRTVTLRIVVSELFQTMYLPFQEPFASVRLTCRSTESAGLSAATPG